MIGIVQKRLKRLAKGLHLVAKGGNIAGQVEIAGQRQKCAVRHDHGAFEFYRVFESNVLAKKILACRHLDHPPIGHGIGGLEGGAIICCAIAHSAVIAHINPAQHVAQEHGGDIFHLDVINAHHPAIWPLELQANMGRHRPKPQRHIYTRACARAQNGADCYLLAIALQRHRRAGVGGIGQGRTLGIKRQDRNPQAGHCARHGLDPGRNPQVAAR